MIRSIQTLTAGDDSGDDKKPAAAALAGIAAAPEPLPVGPPLPPPLDLDRAIPVPWLRDFIRGIAEEVQFDPQSVALLAVGVLSGAAQAAWRIRLVGNWTEEVTLWSMVLAEPGNRKSGVFNQVMGPIREWEEAEEKKLALALAIHSDKRDALEARLKAAKAGQRRREGEPGESPEELRAQLMEFPQLAAPRLTTKTPTPEALYTLLLRNGGKLIVAGAEMDSATLLGTRYSENAGPNLNTQLSMHDGENVAPDRAGKDSPPVPRACGAMVICTQPTAVEEMLKSRASQGFGFVDRFFLCRARELMGERQIDPPPPSCPEHLRQEWRNCIFGLLAQPWKGRVVLAGSGLKLHDGPPVELRLSAGAAALFTPFRVEIEGRKKPSADLRPLSGFGGKLPGGIARIAALLELAKDRHAVEISGESMWAALSWAEWLIGHARFVRGRAAESFEVGHARRIIESHLPAFGEGAEVSGRDLFNRARTSELDSMEKFRPVLALLSDLGFLVELPAAAPEPGTVGRPASKRYLVRLPAKEAAA